MKLKLSLLVTAIMTVVAGAIAILLLNRVTKSNLVVFAKGRGKSA